jgi:hypothetical protein
VQVKRKTGLALAVGRRRKRKLPVVWSSRRRALLSAAMVHIWATYRRELNRA